MTSFLKSLAKVPMFWVFVAICLIYGTASLGMPAEIDRYAIVTAVGIDMLPEEEQYEISLLTFIPIAEQGFAETYKVVSSKGRSISEAIDFAGLHLGREIGLSHVKTVVLNREILNENLSKILDYLSRSEHLVSSTKLISTDASAKEFLQAAQSLDSGSAIKISELINFNDEYIYATDSSFESFFKGYFGPTRVSVMPFLTLKSSKSEGLTAVGDQGEQNSGEQSAQSKEIVNNGDAIIFKDGKQKVMVDGIDMKKLNLVHGNFNIGTIVLENYSDDHFDNATLTFEIVEKVMRYRVDYQNGIPVVGLSSRLVVTLSEAENQQGMVAKNIEFDSVDQKMLEAIKQKVKNLMGEAIVIMRDNQVDICDFYTLLHNHDKKEFSHFLSLLDDQNDYLNRIVFKVSVDVFVK